MLNEAQVSVVGYVASEPSYMKVGRDGIPKLTMRVAWTTRHRDTVSGQWIDGNTSFVSVICWRRLADNLSTSLRKGDPIVLRGRLDVRSFVGRDGQRHTSVDVEANTLGHDLNRGVARFQRIAADRGNGVPQSEDVAMADGRPAADAGRELVADADRELVADAGRELVADADREFIADADAQLGPDDGELVPAEGGPAGEAAFDDVTTAS
jgi:single-strand DNA-binding protein